MACAVRLHSANKAARIMHLQEAILCGIPLVFRINGLKGSFLLSHASCCCLTSCGQCDKTIANNNLISIVKVFYTSQRKKKWQPKASNKKTSKKIKNQQKTKKSIELLWNNKIVQKTRLGHWQPVLLLQWRMCTFCAKARLKAVTDAMATTKSTEHLHCSSTFAALTFMPKERKSSMHCLRARFYTAYRGTYA